MDEGSVALVAAGVGLVGAIGGAAIGGLAATRGARIGAETAARATARQVQDQAVTDHDHWLRGQVLDACRSFLSAYVSYAIHASNMTRAVERELRELMGELGGACGQAVTDFRNAYFQVRLVAAEDVRQCAQELTRLVEEHRECVDAWLKAFLDMNGSAVAAARAEEERLRGLLARLHTEFMETAWLSVSRHPAAGSSAAAAN